MKIIPNVYRYNIMINGLGKNKKMNEGMNLLKQMHMKIIVADSVTYTSLTDGLCKSGRISYVLDVMDEVHERGFEAIVIIVCTYNVYTEGLLDEALIIWSKMEDNGCVRA
ncbi:unnamed protein product [Sphenostylis stenocarpa]|uniref:Pentatricopeptide repeat-containing protein n=1 Tax=Sphenostylis stenocarpa TaxID=92480 RepID=A0AA86T604_9FABA|nr:unnamed protein product [Sphenostylis stenocarpa]